MTRDHRMSPLLWTPLAALVVVLGCGQNSATAPSPTRIAATPSAAAGPFETYPRVLSGRVLDENGSPVPGAAVVAYSGSATGCCDTAMPPVLTDSQGEYQTVVTALKPPFVYAGTSVTITGWSAGFGQTNGFAAGTTDTVQDFRLFRPLTLTPGTDLHLRLDSDNSLCGLEDEFRCRTVYVSGPAGAVVTVETIPDDPAQPAWLSNGIGSSVTSGQTHLSFPTAAILQMFAPDSTAGVGFVIRATVQ